MMAHEFFKKRIPDDEWKKIIATGEVDKYDANELKHVREMEGEVTLEGLVSIIEDKKRQAKLQVVEHIINSAKIIQRKLQEGNTDFLDEITTTKRALDLLESFIIHDEEIIKLDTTNKKLNP
jgi:hypothetical protein